jgi:hypothetical protein
MFRRATLGALCAPWCMECTLRLLEIVLNGAAPTGKTVCVVMQNPSYAGEDVADKSVQFMEKVVFQKGLAEFTDVRRLIVVNQFVL